MSFLIVFWLLSLGFNRLTSADFSVLQDDSNSNSSGIRLCVRLDNPPGVLFRNNIPTGHSNLHDIECVFDSGLDQSRAYLYKLEDSLDNVVSNIMCTHPVPPYDLRADLINGTTGAVFHRRLSGINPSFYVLGVHEDNRELDTFQDDPDELQTGTGITSLDLFTNYTFSIYQMHSCPHTSGSVLHKSEKALSNTIRTAPNGVSISVSNKGSTSITFSISAQDFDWSLDYIMRRDGTIVGTFTHPEYFGAGNQWIDTDVEAATEYSYQMEEKDQMNGYSEFSETVKVCTGPPEVLNFGYTLDSTLKVTFTWNIPLPNTLYEKAIAAQITTNYLAQDTRSNLSSPYTWPYALDPTTAYHFHLRLYITCNETQDAAWNHLIIRANKPQISVSLVDNTTVSVNFPNYQQFVDVRLYMNSSEVLPRPLSYPATVSNLIRGQTFSFNVDAKQFQEDAQSSNALIAMPAEIIEKEPKTTPQPIFVCPTPPAPVQVDYETFNNSTITITWIAINDNLNDAEYIPNFDVMDPNDKLATGLPISTTSFGWSGELLPLTHYIFHVRSTLQCQQNGEKTFSDWIQIDAYTPPPKPVLTIVEAGDDYVVLDVHSDEVYETISLFINDFKQSQDPPAWPYRVDILELTVSYKFAVEVSKYGQTTRSEEVFWSVPTTEPFPTTTKKPFVCPIPAGPSQVGYSSIDNSTIVLVWSSPDGHKSDSEFQLMFDVKDSKDQIEQNITGTHFTWSGDFIPLTHYSFYVRSSLFCRQNGENTYSDWSEVDAYTPPSKPALVIVDRGVNYVLLDVYNSEIYDSISLFINDIKQTPDPPTWPHKVVFIVAAPSYRFYVAGTKYEQTARSDEVYWSTTTIAPTPDPAAPGKDDSDGPGTGMIIWAILAAILILLLTALLIGFFVRARWQKSRTQTQGPRTVYAEYEGPAVGSYIQALHTNPQYDQGSSNFISNSGNLNCDMNRESNAYEETKMGDDKSCSREKTTSSYYNPGLEQPRASRENEYWTPNGINIYEPNY
ncbi:uncharacterized protein LOC142337018 isoform X1 [Convolutriloba macropyga]|uniref:uncharacterized protein LOC142337018 isoform X1 n=1 Tax=Convolutriloba macropyga TaxID=536237 RepID=UPI003F51C2A1